MFRINGDVFDFTGELNWRKCRKSNYQGVPDEPTFGKAGPPRSMLCSRIPPCNQVSLIKLAVVGWTPYIKEHVGKNVW